MATITAWTSPSEKKPLIVFLISEDIDNYEAHKTIPLFAKQLEQECNYSTSVLLGTGDRTAFQYPDLQKLKKADAVIVFTRRVALRPKQMDLLKNYIKKGKPIIGIRTANHAFTLREEASLGYEDWKEFVADVLGCENRGYGPVGPGIDVKINTSDTSNGILKGLPDTWRSDANLYLVAPLLDPGIKILIQGTSDGKTEPIAWTRNTSFGGKVFYTSLGHPSDFENPNFIKMLQNAIGWAIDKS